MPEAEHQVTERGRVAVVRVQGVGEALSSSLRHEEQRREKPDEWSDQRPDQAGGP